MQKYKKQEFVLTKQLLADSLKPGSVEGKNILKQINTMKVSTHKNIQSMLSELLKERQIGGQQLLQQLCELCELLKSLQINPLIMGIVYTTYKQAMQMTKLSSEVLHKQWKRIPLAHLQDFITFFKLQKYILHEDRQDVVRLIQAMLNQNKIKEASIYYLAFQINDPKFEKEEFLPKLLKGNDLYSTSVLKLLQYSPSLLNQLLERSQPLTSIKILECLKKDIRQYADLIEYLERQNYQHHAKQFKDWFKMEERFSFNPKFMKWYADQYCEGEIRQSILARIFGSIQKVENPLYSKDRFTFTEEILQKHDVKYWKFSEFQIPEGNVIFVADNDKQGLQYAESCILKQNIVGFDSQFNAVSHKLEPSKASILQISAANKVFIFDVINNVSPALQLFIQTLFYSKQILKIGHTIKSDLTELSKSLRLDPARLDGFVDIVEQFKNNYPTQNQSSLSFITVFLTGRPLSKYEQRSNWNRRPLRKCQLHYAAMDAFICQYLYNKLNKGEVQQQNKEMSIKVEKNTHRQVIITDNFSYALQFKHWMDNPKFLVDNMLKKLCTYLRNLGIDSEFIQNKDWPLAISIATKQERIIVTKDKAFFNKKNIRVPIYLLTENDSQKMTKQLAEFFKIDLSKLDLLSRCVKCNSKDIKIISTAEAVKKLNFTNNDIQQFWICGKCNQIYWQGQSFKNACKRFEGFKE